MTRTDYLLNEAREQDDTLAGRIKRFNTDLLNYWQCHDPRCRNEDGWCFVDFTGKHYDFDHNH